VTLGIVATDTAGAVPMMAVDQFALFFKVYAALTVLFVSLIATDYVRNEMPYQGEFYALTLLAALSLMLVAGSVNLVMIYLSFEFLSIVSYILTGYLRDSEKSVEGAVKYFIYGATASGVMLYGFSLLYGATGSLDLQGIAVGLANADPSVSILIIPAIVLVVTGLGFKIALVPFHQWAPEAYQGAPTPITAFLSVGPKAAGFALLTRVMFIAFPDAFADWITVLTGIAILTMTFGNLVAMWQTDIKRLFAYSSIAQAGYMLIGVIAIAPAFLQEQSIDRWDGGLNGMLFYLLAYLLTNIGAFGVIIAVENKTHSSNIETYAGLIRRAPLLAIAFVVFLLSLIGIPPTAGFVGKFFVLGAAVNQQMFLLAGVGILNSVISAYYYLAIIRKMIFDEATDLSPIPVGRSLNLTVVATMVLVVLLAIWAQPFINWTTNSAQILASNF
jgi:proton-translocating NADH-quinone oxidoreductase chain N